MKKILIVTPIYGRSGSGASTYYKLLVRKLRECGIHVVVVSEKDKEISTNYHGIFPARAGLGRRYFLDRFLYIIQNIKYVMIPIIFLKEKPNVIIIHSSFFNHPNLLSLILKISNFFGNKYCKELVFDFRDNLCSLGKIKKLIPLAKKVIACSENVFNHLIEAGVKASKLVHIPIPHQVTQIPESSMKKFSNKFSLEHKNYIAYAGLIKPEKNVDLLIKSYLSLAERRSWDFPYLVLAGIMKGDGDMKALIQNSKNVSYIGNLSSEEVKCFFHSACLCVNISEIEGLPRSCLEALEQEVPVILPPNVPEFIKSCSEVTWNGNLNLLDDLLLSQIDSPEIIRYDFGKHCPDLLAQKYLSLM